MRYINGFFAFWYDFIVGDDWTVAAAVVAMLVIAFAIAHTGIAFFWFPPIAVALIVAWSVWRAAQQAG